MATTRTRLRRCLVALAGLLVLGGVMDWPTQPASATTPAAPGPCSAGWQTMPVPDEVLLSVPFDVLTRRGRPAWILGSQGAARSDEGILAVRWTGTRWRSSTGGSRRQGLVGGEVTGRRSVVAVGYDRTQPGGLTPLGARNVSGRWSTRHVPRPPGSSASLTDVEVLPGGRAWAVGTRLARGRFQAYAARWNGSAWQHQDPPGGRGSGLLDIERDGRGRLWAIGWRDSAPGRSRPLILRLTTRGWRAGREPDLPPGSAVLTDLDSSDRSAWAVGYLVPSGTDRHEVILLRQDGRRWVRVPLPWASDLSALPRSLAVGPGDELWIAGAQLATDERESRGFVAHREDGRWALAILDVPSDIPSEITDIAATRDGAVAAGTIGLSLVVLHSCGEGQAPAARGRRIHVGDMRARRRLRARSFDDGEEPPAPVRVGGSPLPEPAAPVAPTGFRVVDRARAAGLSEDTRTWGGFAIDLDGDGWTDVFYGRHFPGRHSGAPRIALNRQGRFRRAPVSAFSSNDRHGCDVADVDADGALDVLCVMGRVRGRVIARHELSLAVVESGGRLARGAAGIADPLGRGRHVGFLRLDGDRYPEVFITTMPERVDGLPATNRFYRNVHGRFVPAPGVGLDRPVGGACLWTGDMDGDGDDDLAYCTRNGPGSGPPGLRIMRNERGTLRDRTARLGVRSIGDIDVGFADLDGDGHRDLLQLAPDRLRVSRWTPSGYRLVSQLAIGDARAIGIGDASGDGHPDVYVVRGAGLTNRTDLLLVTRPGGQTFTSVRIPQTRRGSADDVIVLDFDRNGLADFIVLNGDVAAGPVQLLASYPVL